MREAFRPIYCPVCQLIIDCQTGEGADLGGITGLAKRAHRNKTGCPATGYPIKGPLQFTGRSMGEELDAREGETWRG